ncbi:MAG: riboflavin biosynthesis protein RibF [Janthinobacterium lividum]
MQVARSLAELGNPQQPSVVTIGNFDGVHCGHQTVIAAVKERARELQARSVVVTFDPHPAHVLRTGQRTALITPLPQKLELLAATGVDLTLVLPFTEELRQWTARQFAQWVLCDALRTAEIHEGETFRFGHKAEADVQGLTRLGQELCFSVRTYEPVVCRGAAISSSRIRALVAAGEVGQARTLLGRSFAVESLPASGRGFGTRYAVPTINLAAYPELLPANGVYITTLAVGLGSQARHFRGVTNAGNRPTFGADSFAVETHLFQFEPIELTAETRLRLTFLQRLRGEQRFPSPEALKAQIGVDVGRAQQYFRLYDALH